MALQKCLLDQAPPLIQNKIREYAFINYEEITFTVKKERKVWIPEKDTGEISFQIKDINHPSSLGTFQFQYDFDFNAADPHQELQFYTSSESCFNECYFMSRVLYTLFKFIFDTYANISTVSIPLCGFLNEDKRTKMLAFFAAQNIFNLYPGRNNRVYLFREFKNPLFKHTNLPKYNCTLLIKNEGGFMTNISATQRAHNNSVVFFRKCLIFSNGQSVIVVFDKPCTFITSGVNYKCDICFKLKINDTLITGDKLSFASGFDHSDWEYRINKYSRSRNINKNGIDNMRLSLYWHLQTRQFKQCDYNYGEFETKIRNSGLQTIDLNSDELDDSILDELQQLTDIEMNENDIS